MMFQNSIILKIQKRTKLLTSNVIELLSFNSEIETLVDTLNHKLKDSLLLKEQLTISHPGGFIKELRRRRISMAQSYIRIIKFHATSEYEQRLDALKIMLEDSLHAKTTSMPLNTARVQIALMKDAVKAYGNRRKQLEAMTDFGQASFGHPPVIRKFLNKLHIIEVPEKDLPLKDLNLGFDDHVHDMFSEGRKTPTQLLLDAFVKGISELTVVYSDIDAKDTITETIIAGQILGIRVKIGIEFSVGKGGERRHYMYIPPIANDSKTFFDFCLQNKAKLDHLWQLLKINQERRRSVTEKILQRVNETQIAKINNGISPESPFYMEQLKMDELILNTGHTQVSRIHIGELFYQKIKKAFYPRVLNLRAHVQAAKQRYYWGNYSKWELQTVVQKYDLVRKQYEEFTPESLYLQYIDDKDVVDYDSAILDEKEILPILKNCNGSIVMLHPVAYGQKKAIRYVLENVEYLTFIELFNLRDSGKRNPSELLIFNSFLDILNNKTKNDMNLFLRNHGIFDLSYELIDKAYHEIAQKKIIPVCGSDSTGRDPSIPGMGFIKESDVSQTIKNNFKDEHFKIPKPIAQMILNKGTRDTNGEFAVKDENIFCLGKIGRKYKNLIGDEDVTKLPKLKNIILYLNPSLKNMIRICIGFFVAYHWIGIEFALIWFGITFFRNVLVDLIASSGLDIASWSRKKINFENAGQSLFWTGFSVPILSSIKSYFDLIWPFKSSGLLFEASKFFVICIANGTYIATHNTLRNFDKKTIRMNFFRTVIAWPFATIFSPIGNLLQIPSIVQAKIWSDVVGGVIEGSGKYWQRFNLRFRDLNELLPRLESENQSQKILAMIDILYIWSKQARGKSCLKKLLFPKKPVLFLKKEVDINQQQKAIKIYKTLIELFSDPTCMERLNEYIIKHFKGKEALLLTDLVGRNTEAFWKWLKNNNKKK